MDPIEFEGALSSSFAPTPEQSWLWRGFLGPGKMTLLTAQWKSGKTTLLSHLLAQRVTGGSFLDLPVAAGASAVVSEERREMWTMRMRSLDFGRTCFFCRPFSGRPSLEQMRHLTGRLADMKKEHGVDLAVFDTLAMFLPAADENNANLVMAALEPFAALAAAGLSVLLIHHPRKGEAPLGQAARGSGALLGAVDIFVEMRLPAGDPFTRRRRLVAWSRFEETPREMLIELTPHSGYRVLPSAPGDYHDRWPTVQEILSAAETSLTRQQIRRAWPSPSPGDTALWKLLSHAVDLGVLLCEGEGTKTDPFRYRLAGKGVDAA